MSFESFISKRYFQFKGNRPPLLTFLIRISLFSIAVSVFALIFVMAIMEGFERDFQKRILGFRAPLLVVIPQVDQQSELKQYLESITSVTRVVPFVEGETIIQADNGMTVGMRIRGIGESPSEQRLGQLLQNKSFENNSMILGDELAGSLRVHPDFNEKMTLIFPLGEVGPTGDLIPHIREVKLTGLFHSGYYDFDHKYGIISFDEARKLLGTEGKQGFEVWFDDVHETNRIVKNIKDTILAHSSQLTSEGKDITIETWLDQNPKLFAALRLERWGMGALLAMLMLVASFNIFSVLSLTVIEKKKDMGLLKALGLPAQKIRKIFLSYAVRLAVWGGGFGFVTGVMAVVVGIKYPLRLPPTYYIDKLPLSFSIMSLVIVAILVPLIVMISAYYPALKASQTDPLDSLQREVRE